MPWTLILLSGTSIIELSLAVILILLAINKPCGIAQVKKRALSLWNKEENLVVTGSPRHDNFFKSVGKGNSKGMILFATTAVIWKNFF